MPTSLDYIKETDDAYLINIRLQPKASSDGIVGVADCEVDGDGLTKQVLKIRLTQPPVDGKANEALLKFLSKILKVPKSKLKITKGLKSRNKVVRIGKVFGPLIENLL